MTDRDADLRAALVDAGLVREDGVPIVALPLSASSFGGVTSDADRRTYERYAAAIAEARRRSIERN